MGQKNTFHLFQWGFGCKMFKKVYGNHIPRCSMGPVGMGIFTLRSSATSPTFISAIFLVDKYSHPIEHLEIVFFWEAEGRIGEVLCGNPRTPKKIAALYLMMSKWEVWMTIFCEQMSKTVGIEHLVVDKWALNKFNFVTLKHGWNIFCASWRRYLLDELTKPSNNWFL